MSAPDVDRQVMEKFAALSGDSHLTLVLGAGASVPSGLPKWDTFAQHLMIRSGLVGTESAAITLLGKQDPTIALEAAHARSGDDWEQLLNEALYGAPSGRARSVPFTSRGSWPLRRFASYNDASNLEL